MLPASDEFQHESLQDRESIVKYLTAITEGLKTGSLELGNGDNRMVLEPNGLLKLDLKARRKDGRLKLSFKVSWKEQELDGETDTEPLIIGHKRS